MQIQNINCNHLEINLPTYDNSNISFEINDIDEILNQIDCEDLIANIERRCQSIVYLDYDLQTLENKNQL